MSENLKIISAWLLEYVLSLTEILFINYDILTLILK